MRVEGADGGGRKSRSKEELGTPEVVPPSHTETMRTFASGPLLPNPGLWNSFLPSPENKVFGQGVNVKSKSEQGEVSEALWKLAYHSTNNTLYFVL